MASRRKGRAGRRAERNRKPSEKPGPRVSGSGAPQLAPIWAERHDVLTGLEGLGFDLSKLRSLEGLLMEEATLKAELISEDLAQIAADGRVLFDPPSAASPIFSPSRVSPLPSTKRPGGLPPEPTWRHPAWFLCLPSVQSYIGTLLQRQEILGRLTPEMRAEMESQISLGIEMMFLHAAWGAYGRRAYYVDAGTTELLLQTPLPALGAEELKFPLPSFSVMLPPGRFHFAVDSDPEPQEADSIHVVAAGDDPDEDRFATIMICGRSRKNSGDDNFYTGMLYIPKGIPLSALSIGNKPPEGLGIDLPKLVIGLCLYLASEHPLLEPVAPPAPPVANQKSKRKIQKAEQRASRRTKLGFIWVGGRDPDHADVSDIPTPDTGRGWSLDHSFWVQGHWRLQPYGPGRSQRKLIWIKPHRRGPDFAAAAHARRAQVQPASAVR